MTDLSAKPVLVRSPGALPSCIMVARAPEIALVIWFMTLGIGIWLHAHANMQPPIADAFTYYEKAHNVWVDLNAGHWLRHPFQIFNTEPVFRPPGTVLMSYPFGFHHNPNGFFFRSVFFPAMLLAISVMITTYTPDQPWRQRATSALSAAFFSTLPMFYFFDVNPAIPAPGYWGLVDPFLTGSAAFAMACAYRSVTLGAFPSRWMWYALAGLMAGFCIAIKPSGAAVAACVGFGWLVLAASRLILGWGNIVSRWRLVINLGLGGAILSAPIVLILREAVTSRYLSGQDLAVGKANIAIMRSELTLPFDYLVTLAHYNFGSAFEAWIVVSIVLMILAAFTSRHRVASSVVDKLPVTTFFLATGVTFFGIWFWIFATGGANQMRYGMPFFLMALILILPAFHASSRMVSWWFNVPGVLIMILAPLNLALLLYLPDPSVTWQTFSGVSISAPDESGVVKTLTDLVNTPRSSEEFLYSMTLGLPDGLAGSIVAMHQLSEPTAAPLNVRRPFDWVRPSTYRIEEIVSSDYLMVPPADAGCVSPLDISTLNIEMGTMTCWANGLTATDGVQRIYGGSDMVLLKIKDQVKMRTSLLAFVAKHHWRAVFLTENNLPLDRINH